MNKLQLYAVFHANLNYSRIPSDSYPEIVRNCYWPVVRIVEELGIPLGLEMSAHTLQVINSLDPSLVARLRRLWEQDQCEIIGCGFVQSIMPLIPARVNRENLARGNAVYERLLGRRPEMAFVNEQVYSASLPGLYQEAGYRSLMVNWDSSPARRTGAQAGYHPCAVLTGDGRQMPVIWHSQAASYEFQHYIWDRISLESYLAGVLEHIGEDQESAYPLYTSDWEIFDFKPWNAIPEGFHQPKSGEVARISELLALLQRQPDVQFVSPGAVISRSSELPIIVLEDSEFPITYKKQDQHSMARWAVGGSDGVRLNSQCYQLYQELTQAEWFLQHASKPLAQESDVDALWQELCFLWNSDFRTFTTEEKCQEFRGRMGVAQDRARRLNTIIGSQGLAPEGLWVGNLSRVPAESEPVAFSTLSNGAGDNGHDSYDLQTEGQTVPCQVTQRSSVGEDSYKLTLEVSPKLLPGTAKTATIIPSPHPSFQQGRDYHIDRERSVIETATVRLELEPAQGGTIRSLTFPQLMPKPLIQPLPEAEFEDQGHEDGILPGDLVLEDWSGKRVNDRGPTQIQYPANEDQHRIFVPLRCVVELEQGTIWKTYRVYLEQARVDIFYRFRWQGLAPNFFRLGRMAFNPDAFDRDTLYYATTNGGDEIERFTLAGHRVQQDRPLGENVSSHGCLGATEGWVVVGDAAKGIGFVTKPAALYSVPLVNYQETAGGQAPFRLTLSHSLGEEDATSHTFWRGYSTWGLSVMGGQQDILELTRASALLTNGGLIALTGVNHSAPDAEY